MFIARLLLAPVVLAGLAGAEDATEIVRHSIQVDQRMLERAKDYAFQQTTVERDLDRSGAVTSTDTKTYDVFMLYGHPFHKLTARNGKPLAPKDREKEEKRLQKAMDERKNESEKQRAKREREEQEARTEFHKVSTEIPNACILTLTGEEEVGGRPAWVIQAVPRPGYKPPNKDARILTKLRGRLWIDKADYHWTKLEAETIDTLSFGWVFARLSPGTRIEVEQVRVNDEIWAPSRVHLKVDVRVALLKKFRKDVDVTFRDYRKFQTDSRIVATTEQ